MVGTLNKHILARTRICQEIADLSNCNRGKVGAVVIDPNTFTILADGYNGGPRGASGKLCGGDRCTRTDMKIPSGTNTQVGCHHAEMNALANAGRNGVKTLGAAMIISCEPCVACAKQIHHFGISCVYVISGTYSTTEGIDYLAANGVDVTLIEKEDLGPS